MRLYDRLTRTAEIWHGRPDPTGRTLRNGWLRTDDVGCLDEDWQLFVVGEIVYPADTENAPYRCGAVTEVAVAGEDQRSGRLVHVLTASAAELRDLLAATPAVYGFATAGPRPANAVSREVRANQAVGREAIHAELRVEELQRLRDSDTVRVIDALAVQKSADGEITTMRLSNLTLDEQVELGAKIGALVGIGASGDVDGAEQMARTGAEIAAEHGVEVFSEGEWDALEEEVAAAREELRKQEHKKLVEAAMTDRPPGLRSRSVTVRPRDWSLSGFTQIRMA